MANHASYACKSCGDLLMIEEESDLDILRRDHDIPLIKQASDKNKNVIVVGDYVKFKSMSERDLAGPISLITEYNCSIKVDDTFYTRKHLMVEKISQDEYMIYKLEN